MKNKVINAVIIALILISASLLPTIAFAGGRAGNSTAETEVDLPFDENYGGKGTVEKEEETQSDAIAEDKDSRAYGSWKPEGRKQVNTEDRPQAKEYDSSSDAASSAVSDTDVAAPAESGGDADVWSLTDVSGSDADGESVATDITSAQGDTAGSSAPLDGAGEEPALDTTNRIKHNRWDSGNTSQWSSGNLNPRNDDYNSWASSNILNWARRIIQPRSNGNHNPWSNGNLYPWRNGKTRPWTEGNLKPWSNGNLDPWSSGDFNPSNNGSHRPWSDGYVRPWSNGNLRPWSGGNLYPWSNGKIRPWTEGNLKLWSSGNLNPSNIDSHRPWGGDDLRTRRQTK